MEFTSSPTSSVKRTSRSEEVRSTTIFSVLALVQNGGLLATVPPLTEGGLWYRAVATFLSPTQKAINVREFPTLWSNQMLMPGVCLSLLRHSMYASLASPDIC